jgi:hypothetical protein
VNSPNTRNAHDANFTQSVMYRDLSIITALTNTLKQA